MNSDTIFREKLSHVKKQRCQFICILGTYFILFHDHDYNEIAIFFKEKNVIMRETSKGR